MACGCLGGVGSDLSSFSSSGMQMVPYGAAAGGSQHISVRPSLKVVLLHGSLDIWVYDAQRLPNKDMFSKRVSDLLGPRITGVVGSKMSNASITRGGIGGEPEAGREQPGTGVGGGPSGVGASHAGASVLAVASSTVSAFPSHMFEADAYSFGSRVATLVSKGAASCSTPATPRPTPQPPAREAEGPAAGAAPRSRTRLVQQGRTTGTPGASACVAGPGGVAVAIAAP